MKLQTINRDLEVATLCKSCDFLGNKNIHEY